MSKVEVCDLCDAHWPEYEFKYKVKHTTWYFEKMVTKYHICDKCWTDLKKKVEKKRKKH